jgi:Flp pilus assembly CpaE family ATPase
MAGVSKAVLIVFQLAVKDIHIVRSLREAMVDRGVPVGRIIPVVSRYTKRSQITLEEARTALDGSRLIVLSNDYATVIKSVNYGKPLAQTAPSTALRREIRQLAVELGSDKQGGRP